MVKDFFLTEKEFFKLREIVYEEAGIKLSDAKRVLMQSRLVKRLRQLKLNSFGDYYDYLQNNYDLEKDNFINLITTNKTDFFRENDHFEFMKSVVLPAIDRNGQNEIRIWSAGCSTGEEPYTLAIVLNEFFENRKKPDVKILATDIDTNVLQHGINGVYSVDQVKKVHDRIKNKYFLKGEGENEGFYKIKDHLKRYVYFRRLNLLSDSFPMKRQFDLIFCRNVIIYFDKDCQRKMFSNFYPYLKDEGYLMVGHSENISTVTDKFVLNGRTIYRKVK